MGQSVLLCFSTLCSCSRTLVTILRFWPTQTYITQGWCPCWFNHQNCYRNRRTCWGIHISTRATPLRNKMQLTACCVRQRFWTTGVPEVTMLQSWKKSTLKKKQHGGQFKKWTTFCSGRKMDSRHICKQCAELSYFLFWDGFRIQLN